MLNENVRAAFEELAEEVKRIVNERISRYGINPKTGTNTLEGSNLQKSLQIDTMENSIELQIDEYWKFISSGWQRTRNKSRTIIEFVEIR